VVKQVPLAAGKTLHRRIVPHFRRGVAMHRSIGTDNSPPKGLSVIFINK